MRHPFVAIIVGLLLLAPTATAIHWTAHEQGIGRAPAETREDDGEIFESPGHPAHGVVNQVTALARTPGDGGLFLDARLAWHAGLIGSGFDLNPGWFVDGMAPGASVLLPTAAPPFYHLSAYYGWWNDFDGDGVIDDVHDAACGGPSCGADEFVWRGLASGESVGMVAMMSPAHYFVTATGNTSSTLLTETVEDHTARSNAEQVWEGAYYYNGPDSGLLTTIRTLTLAGARKSVGSAVGYDIHDPDALRDVDRYTAVDPTVGVLWDSTARFAVDQYQGRWADVGTAIDDVQEATDGATDLPFAIYGIAWAAAFGVIGMAVDAALEARDNGPQPPPLDLPQPKEPNHVLDDFEGRALFDGTADVHGAYNDYSGYRDSHQFWYDVTISQWRCAGLYVTVPGTSVELSQWLACGNAGNFDPRGGIAGNSERTASYYAMFRALPVVWMDRNGDAAVGAICDPATEDFDAERNHCRPGAPVPADGLGETIGVCEVTTAKGGTLTVQPVGADWPLAIVVRDLKETTRVAYERHWEIPTGTDPVTIRWENECESPSLLYARDALMFPEGSNTVPLLVTSEAILADGFTNEESGVSVPHARVLDVDLIPASL